MKKIFAISFSILFCLLACVSPCSAKETSQNIYYYENAEVIFEEDSPLTNKEKQRIADFLIYGSDVESYGLQCTLFGHKYTTTQTKIIRHKVYPDAPRCVEEITEVKICSRCNHVEERILSSYRFDCCS